MQPISGNSNDQVIINGGNAQLGDNYITVYQDGQREGREWLQFLASLRYPEMNARFNEISDAGHKTFEWVFDSVPPAQRSGSSLAAWLTNGTGTLLVQGKQVQARQWAGPLPVMLLFHSFWLIGTKTQHNFKGFLASLSHQIISKRHDLISICRTILKQDFKHTLNDWNENGLKKLLLALCKSAPFALCIFIDGLDEFDHDDDFDKLHKLITEIQQLGTCCKLCLSTRPLSYILDYFEDDPSIRLQDLTKDDISNYVHETLQSKARSIPKGQDKDYCLECIKETICQKADGVFLWVHYVLRNVCGGLRIGDDLRALQQRISLLPAAIENLYRHMWNSQNADNVIHAKEASAIFSFGRHFPMPLFQLQVALQPMLIDHYLRSVTVMEEEYLRQICEIMPRQLQARSAGLIECVESNETWDDDLGAWHDNFWGTKGVLAYRVEPWRRIKVQYIHRTVRDFLTESEEGRLMIGNGNNLSIEEVDKRWLQSYLACFIEDVRGFSMKSLGELCSSTAWLSQRQCDLLDVMDKVGEELVIPRLRVRSSQGRNWWFEIHARSTNDSYFHTDFPGLVAGNSHTCMSYLLATRGQGWSSYYKGYLAFCVIIHTLWNDAAPEADTIRMLSMLRELQKAGADLMTPHPYDSAWGGMLVVRSPAARLVQELCVTLLSPHHRLISIDSIVNLMTLLSSLDMRGQNFTLFWAGGWEHSLDGFSIAPQETRNCMITFDASVVLDALDSMLRDYRQVYQKSEYSTKNYDLSANSLSQQFSILWPTLVKNIRILGYNVQSTTPRFKFADCTSEESDQLFDLVFRRNKEYTLDEIVLSDFVPPGWPMSDLNFQVKWEDIRRYLRPLDPYADIGPQNWMEKGCLKDYFASKNESQSPPAATTDSAEAVVDTEDIVGGDSASQSKPSGDCITTKPEKRRLSLEETERHKRRA